MKKKYPTNKRNLERKLKANQKNTHELQNRIIDLEEDKSSINCFIKETSKKIESLKKNIMKIESEQENEVLLYHFQYQKRINFFQRFLKFFIYDYLMNPLLSKRKELTQDFGEDIITRTKLENITIIWQTQNKISLEFDFEEIENYFNNYGNFLI